MYIATDSIWENPACSIARFALELERFVCDCATPKMNKKLRSKGVALLCTHITFLYTMNELEINLGGAVQNECKGQASLELRRRAAYLMPKKLKR